MLIRQNSEDHPNPELQQLSLTSHMYNNVTLGRGQVSKRLNSELSVRSLDVYEAFEEHDDVAAVGPPDVHQCCLIGARTQWRFRCVGVWKVRSANRA